VLGPELERWERPVLGPELVRWDRPALGPEVAQRDCPALGPELARRDCPALLLPVPPPASPAKRHPRSEHLAQLQRSPNPATETLPSAGEFP
jgi:hypothetical protein